MTSTDNSPLGVAYKDRTSGLIGIAIQKSEKMNASIQFALQPVCDSGDKITDAFNVDVHHLIRWPEKDPSDPLYVAEAIETSGAQLGDKIRDLSTDLEGVAIEKITYLNGCIFFKFYIINKLTGVPEPIFCDQSLVKVLKPSLVERKPSPISKGIVNGGPSTRISANKVQR